MTATLTRTAAAELLKLRGLPAVLATGLGTVVTGAVLAAALASSARSPTDAPHVVLRLVPLLQAGPILLGVLAVTTEYAGRQIATTLAVTPNRLLLLAGKTAAYLVAATATSVAAIGAALAAAWLTLAARHVGPAGDADGWPLAGAVVYLVLIGLLSLGPAVLLRSLIPALVGMLGLVLIVSPLLSGYTGHARWLPDRAGSLLYLPHADPVLGPGTGTVVLLAWTALTASAASVTFLSRDA